MTRRPSLIDDWLPIAELSVESRRERGASSALPPLYFLHVWWARRPLTASRAAVLGSLLPAWSEDWPEPLRERFFNQDEYRKWFTDLLGIDENVVEDRQRILEAKDKGIRLARAYAGPRAFTFAAAADDLHTLRQLLKYRWGTATPTVLDPTAGGGSIPFEAIRFGLPTLANELNPVASVVLEGTLTLPARFGPDLADDIALWGRIWAKRVIDRLECYFPHRQGEAIRDYLFARTVTCPETGKPVPLSPNWWLRTGKKPVAARIIAEPGMSECRFEIVGGDGIDFDPGIGTVRRGTGRSPWTGATISGDHIKAEAQAGQMKSQMYAVVIDAGRGMEFRVPGRIDLEAVRAAEKKVNEDIEEWLLHDIVPDETIPPGTKTAEAIRYGMTQWREMFSPRQLLVLAIAVEEMQNLRRDIQLRLEPHQAVAVRTYLAMALDKLLNFNAVLCRWQAGRTRIVGLFDRHDFSFKWSFAEMNVTVQRLGMEWPISQITKTYRGIAKLLDPSRQVLFPDRPERAADLVKVYNRDAADLPLEGNSVQAVVMDPPYYDNVQYAELSDFFYVWLKRTAGHLYPQFFSTELTEKATEAVMNPARFVEFDRKNAKALAKADYEAKMTRIFAEAHRVLTDDGVLTVMFNHKKTEAWDTLGQSLIEAGFRIESSWPVHTESEHSLHQARKAAAASTILLTCHKRAPNPEPAWWDDLKAQVRRTARHSAERFRKEGVDGVDLYISTFGPALSVISRHWPVFTSEVDLATGEPRRLRPEEALDLARREVADLRLRGMLLGRRVEFDPVTDWYLLAWDSFRAVEFPYDDARKLALALGVDLARDLRRLRLVTKKQSTVVLQDPVQRRRTGLADTEATEFERLIDAAHALMVTYREDGTAGAERFLERTRLGADSRFHSLVQALVNAIPRTRIKGRFARPEAEDLDGLGVGLAHVFGDLRFPEDPPSALRPTQGEFGFGP